MERVNPREMKSSTVVMEVWKGEVDQVLDAICSVSACSYVAIDTEFPGFLRRTPRRATEEQTYADLKHNVDRLKLIQLGLTMFDHLGRWVGTSWQINFRDLEKKHSDGVDLAAFGSAFWHRFMRPRRGRTKWITFHGLYDFAYLVKMVTRMPLPNTLPQFLELVHLLFGKVYDIKCIASLFGVGEEMGLVRMAKNFKVEWEGVCHQAGPDSVLTALVFWELKKMFGFDEDAFRGLLYSLHRCGMVVNRCRQQRMAQRLPPFCRRPPPFHWVVVPPCHPQTRRIYMLPVAAPICGLPILQAH